ncbi:MAG: UDP-N-acetylmuramoyl-L-alanine--D-glutamate ligase [Pseudomonadota bacterium]
MNAVLKPDNNKRALVVGLGLTGRSCVRHLMAHGYAVRGVDTRPTPPQMEELKRAYPQMELHVGGLPEQLFDDPGLLVVSPGVSLKEPAVARAIERGAQAVGDIELFARAATAPILAITGANGKSTVTALTGAMCQAAGLKTLVGGNIGTPALELLEQPAPDVYVLELSSFQLETTWSLNARAATVLNLTPDHMDRYRDMVEYAAAKARVFRGNGTMVLNADDVRVLGMSVPGRRVVHFGLGAPLGAGDYGVRAHAGEEWLVRGEARLLRVSEVLLAGRHNLANVLAAMALSETVGVPVAAQIEAVRRFRGLPHRTELVADKDGVRWINDSKGTNVGATVAALNGMTAPTILIAGGDGKGQDFGELKPAVAAHARAVVLIGRDAALIEAALGDVVPTQRAEDLHQAVALAQRLAQPGDAVLLSPACASFDMFRNYEHRGDVFRAAVRELVA